MISEFLITGMTCGHCENSVRTEVSAIDGVTEVEVHASNGQLKITSDSPISVDDVIAAVDEAGYSAVSV